MQNPQRVVDMRVPLPWLISTTAVFLGALCSMLWSVAGQSNKLDQLIITNAKLEKRLDDRDEKTDALRERMFNFDRLTDGLKLRVEALERAGK